MEKTVNVVITYLVSAAQGREIEFAIAGWERHFQERFRIILVGEYLPRIDSSRVFYINSPRVADIPGQYRSHLDYVSCLRKVREAFPEDEGFIFVADDCYAVNDFDLADVKFLKMLEPEFNFDPNSPNGWRRDKMKTKRALEAVGLPTRNFTTHLPIWYEWDKVEQLWEWYDMDRESYVLEDLYFNTFFHNRLPYQLNPKDNLKCGVYTTHPDREDLRGALSSKIWITNSPDGYVNELITLLTVHYNLTRNTLLL